MFTSFIDSGFVVHTPFGPRKSGMPDSVLMPAPVRTTIRSDVRIWPATRSIERSGSSLTQWSLGRFTRQLSASNWI